MLLVAVQTGHAAQEQFQAWQQSSKEMLLAALYEAAGSNMVALYIVNRVPDHTNLKWILTTQRTRYRWSGQRQHIYSTNDTARWQYLHNLAEEKDGKEKLTAEITTTNVLRRLLVSALKVITNRISYHIINGQNLLILLASFITWNMESPHHARVNSFTDALDTYLLTVTSCWYNDLKWRRVQFT